MQVPKPLKLSIGAHLLEDTRCFFSVWAPLKNRMVVHFPDDDRKVEMEKGREGYFQITVDEVKAGTNYFFMPDGENDFPDPASYFQPRGVHGPSQVVDHRRFEWQDDAWKGLSFKDLVFYEIHVGTLTEAGTFDAIIPLLDDLADVGINALELMPVNQFPGTRNWGYDGVFPFAVQNSYGGPEGLKRLVNACHRRGIAVFIDVVYNHLGPEGNYFMKYGPYFTNKYWTPWGDAINFDKEWSDGVRDFFCTNGVYWFEQFHVDGLRLDAIHMVHDESACHFWQYLTDQVNLHQQHVGRPLYLVGESDLNDPRTINPLAVGGYGFTGQWLDDFHHALYCIVDQEGTNRYEDFGKMEQLAKAYTDGFVHSGDYVKFRKRRYGASSAGIPGHRFVVFNMNHDQVGNRPLGERLSMIVCFERLKLAAAALFFAPYVPLLFMGEEFGAQVPFYYFVSHGDPELIEAVRRGRKEEFRDFKPQADPPDPADEKTFNDSKLKWEQRNHGTHRIILEWHKKLIRLRREIPALENFQKNDTRAHVVNQTALMIYRQSIGGRDPVVCLLNFSEKPVHCAIPFAVDNWKKILDSRSAEWNSENEVKPLMPDYLSSNEPMVLLPLTSVVYEGETSF